MVQIRCVGRRSFRTAGKSIAVRVPGMTLGKLSGISAIAAVESRSISAENPIGERGQGGRRAEGTGARAARDLGAPIHDTMEIC